MAEYEPPEPKRDFKGNAPKSRLNSKLKGVKTKHSLYDQLNICKARNEISLFRRFSNRIILPGTPEIVIVTA